jgi:hypothetical protein
MPHPTKKLQIKFTKINPEERKKHSALQDKVQGTIFGPLKDVKLTIL